MAYLYASLHWRKEDHHAAHMSPARQVEQCQAPQELDQSTNGSMPGHLGVILQTALVHLVVPPELLNLWLTLHRVGTHIEASLRKVDSILVRTCAHHKQGGV